MSLTTKIFIAMLSGALVGLLLRFFSPTSLVHIYIVNNLFTIIGNLFIALMKMLVVPIVFVSLICGTLSLGNVKALGRLSLKTLVLYLTSTAIAIIIGLFIASLLKIGSGTQFYETVSFKAQQVPTVKEVLLNIIPENPIRALADGNLLQIIIFALFFGIALALLGEKVKKLAEILRQLNHTLMKLILMIMHVAPYAVFCLLAKVFAQLGFDWILQLLMYFLTVILVLFIQLAIIYSLFLLLLARYNPITFIRKILPVMLFAFSTSSSSATIPITLKQLEEKLHVKNSIASFTVPLGATINMDGTAIMQGVATIFIANVYHISLGFGSLISVVIAATLASIGTAGVPGAGIIMLAMVLHQAGLPSEGIGLIIGVDRLLDMLRTAVNVAGDCMVTYVVAKSEHAIGE